MTNNNIIIRDVMIGIFICLFIFLSTISVPLFGFFIAFLLPTPVLFFRLKLGKYRGAIVPIVVFLIIVFVIHGLLADLFFYGSLLLLGFITGNVLEKHVSIEKTIFETVFTTIIICLLLFAFYAFTIDKSFLTIITEYVSKSIELSFQVYSEIGIEQQQINSMAKSSSDIEHVIIRILPSMFTTLLLFITWLNIILVKRILKKDGVTMKWLGVLNHWKAPERLVWFAILTLCSMFISIISIKIIGLNIFIVLMLIYFFQGIAIISFFFKKKEFPLLPKFIFFTLIIIPQIFALLIITLGFFDTWFNYRKLDLKQNLQN